MLNSERERDMFKNVSKHENYGTSYLTFVNYGCCVGCSVEFLREIDHLVKKNIRQDTPANK